MAEPGTETMGYCIHCRKYGRGRYLWPINDRAEAIDQHVGCRVRAAPGPVTVNPDTSEPAG